jgi:hypothetical protein
VIEGEFSPMHEGPPTSEPVNRRAGTRASTLAIAAVFGLAASLGCQSFLPGKLTKFGEERRIIKQAEHDPFPSPADVGIEAAKDAKK